MSNYVNVQEPSVDFTDANEMMVGVGFAHCIPGHNPLNTPSNIGNIFWAGDRNGNFVIQLFFVYGNASAFYRYKWDGYWRNWQELQKVG